MVVGLPCEMRQQLQVQLQTSCDNVSKNGSDIVVVNPLDSQNVSLFDQVNGTNSARSPGLNDIVDLDAGCFFLGFLCCSPWAVPAAAFVVEDHFLCVCENDTTKSQTLQCLHTCSCFSRCCAGTELVVERLLDDSVEYWILLKVKHPRSVWLCKEVQEVKRWNEQPLLGGNCCNEK